MDSMAEILKWLPQGGAAGAVIMVVYLFLKQQDKASDLLVTITDKFKETLTSNQTASDARIALLTDKYQERFVIHEGQYVELQKQMTDLVRDQIAVNTKMTEAINGLQTAVNDLQKRQA